MKGSSDCQKSLDLRLYLDRGGVPAMRAPVYVIVCFTSVSTCQCQKPKGFLHLEPRSAIGVAENGFRNGSQLHFYRYIRRSQCLSCIFVAIYGVPSVSAAFLSLYTVFPLSQLHFCRYIRCSHDLRGIFGAIYGVPTVSAAFLLLYTVFPLSQLHF